MRVSQGEPAAVAGRYYAPRARTTPHNSEGHAVTAPDDLVAQLAAHRFEPEFDAPTPRPIPAGLRVGPFARGRRDAVVGFGVAGLARAGASQLEFVREWGETLLLLAYLDWLGGALVAAGLFAAAYFKLSRGAFEYVRSGEVLAGRVLDFETRVVRYHSGVPVMCRVFARVGYLDPDIGRACEAEVHSDAYSPDRLAAMELTFGVGDVATLVHLPGRRDSTLNLYGFLGLRGDLGLMPVPGVKPPSALLVCLRVASGIVALIWSVDAIGRYWPIDPDFGPEQWSVMAGGAILAGAAALVIEATPARRRAALEARPDFAPRAAVVLLKCAGFFLAGAFAAIIVALALNGRLDAAEPARRPVFVLGRQHRTHKGIVRSYTVTYRFADDPPDGSHRCSLPKRGFDTLAGPDAVARVAPGALGWPWLRDLEPLKLDGPTDPNRE